MRDLNRTLPRPARRTSIRRIPFPRDASGPYPHKPRARDPAPKARRHSVNATVESTPPLTKKNTLRSRATRRICSSTSATRWPGFQSFSQPQISNTKFAECAPLRRMHHLGMKLHAIHAALPASSIAAVAQVEVEASTRKPGWRRFYNVAMRHPDLLMIADATPSSSELRDAVDQDRGSQGRTRPCRPYARIHPAPGRATAARSRSPAREIPPQNVPGSTEGLESVVNAMRPAGDDEDLGRAAAFQVRFAGKHLGRNRVPELSAQSGGSMAACIEDCDLRRLGVYYSSSFRTIDS